MAIDLGNDSPILQGTPFSTHSYADSNFAGASYPGKKTVNLSDNEVITCYIHGSSLSQFK